MAVLATVYAELEVVLVDMFGAVLWLVLGTIVGATSGGDKGTMLKDVGALMEAILMALFVMTI